jgi:replicative DNA helicase
MAVEKLLPQNVEAEAGVLGSLLISPDAVVQVADLLRPEDFYREAHRVIFQAVLDLYESGETADLITLTDELARRGKLEEVGGAAYVSSLANQVPTSLNIKQYAQIVERTSILRRLIQAAGQIAAVAYNEPDADTALQESEKLLSGVSERYARADLEHIRETLRTYIDKLDQLHDHKGSIVGVASGFSDLDKMTGGLQKSDLIILAARPSVGKTALSLSMAHNSSVRFGHSVAIFSLEMSKEQLIQRLLSMDAGVDQQKLRTGYLNDDEWERISDSFGRLSEVNMYIDDTPGITLVEMRSKARRLMQERGFDLLIVDYLQLMQGSGGNNRSHENRVQEISEISRGLKGIARELNVPVVALSQLSRAVESRNDKKPQLSDLRECVAGDTRLVDVDTGRWVPIREVQNGQRVLAMDPQQRIRPFTVEQIWSTGVKSTYRLTTRAGRQIQATSNHPFFTARGWKRLEDLTIGDVIATAMTLPEHGQERPERAELCRLLGYLAGDGSYLKHRSVEFISADPATMEDACAIVREHFPVVVMRDKPCRGAAKQVVFSTTFENGYGKPYGNPLREWLREVGVHGERDSEKHVPTWVFESGRQGCAEYLAGYLASDGCVKVRADSSRGSRWGIQFDTTSHNLAEDVQALLLRIGVVAIVNGGSYNAKSTKLIYRITIAPSAHNLCRFAHLVPVCGKKRLILDMMLAELDGRQPRGVASSIFTLPIEVSEILASRTRAANFHWTETWRHQGKRPSRSTCMAWADRLSDADLRMWAMSDLLWEEVTSITPSDDAEVFDISVPGAANFIGNGIIAHNSGAIEQDADIVMFIYRDEVYNPETDRKNIADIIVAKHRNGPIGQISLYFQAAQTRYRDLELRTPEF